MWAPNRARARARSRYRAFAFAGQKRDAQERTEVNEDRDGGLCSVLEPGGMAGIRFGQVLRF
jgi:hypothetical protein